LRDNLQLPLDDRAIALLRTRTEGWSQARGEIRSDVPAEDLVIMLFAMLDGLQVHWRYDPEYINMARLFEQFLRLLRGI
jgi:hypothetical protein